MGTKKVLTLILGIIVIIAIAVAVVIFMGRLWQKETLEDLRTNLLLIQGKARSYTENVSVETANLDKDKEEENNKIEEVKGQKLKGTAVENCSEEIQNAAKEAHVEDVSEFYYLSQEDLNEMGININVEKDTYYLVKYDFKDTEVVYTKGYKYNNQIYYKLSEIENIEF